MFIHYALHTIDSRHGNNIFGVHVIIIQQDRLKYIKKKSKEKVLERKNEEHAVQIKTLFATSKMDNSSPTH